MWRPDVLGEGWQARDLILRPDAYGDAVATLVRPEPDGQERPGAALYVHGFVDYFFHPHLADLWRGLDRELYAVDLRGYGRSIRPGRPPNVVEDLAVHAEDLDAAVRVLRDELGHDEVVVMGHSTGGLIASLWADARSAQALAGRGDARRYADALVLNSPWLELNRSWFHREVVTRALYPVSRFAPDLVISQLGKDYGEWLHDPAGGGWTYDQAWKPDAGFGVRARWLSSVRRGHRAVARGLSIDVPVLVCTSDASGPTGRVHDAIGSSDSVLSVEQMARLAPRLGVDVTLVQVAGGVH
ncbi:MAG TPA: alpha/beta hydrolase, partial [Actinotalea sp.]|nr:alpha/beta hydrolase [Actinotalea sp.]